MSQCIRLANEKPSDNAKIQQKAFLFANESCPVYYDLVWEKLVASFIDVG